MCQRRVDGGRKVKVRTAAPGKNFVLNPGDTVAVIGCSDPIGESHRLQAEECRKILEGWGLKVRMAASLKHGWWQGEKRGRELTDFYGDAEVKAIFDLSGGDLANTALPYIDWKTVAAHPKPFWGYSDLTALLNAIYAKTGQYGCLYQLRNLVSGEKQTQEKQRADFYRTVFQGEDALNGFSAVFLQGDSMEGTVVGGNLRCLLKLAGTPYFPDLSDKILFLESLGGGSWLTASLFGQLRLMGAFEKIRGLLLGTFTKLQESGCSPDLEEIILSAAPGGLPVAVTGEIGHGKDSKCLIVGGSLKMEAE